MTSQTLKAFCTTSEAARMLGISVRTAQMWAERGLLEAWKTDGGHRRISLQSVERNLVSHFRPTQSHSGASRFTVLVVDDEAAILRLYEREIQKWPMRPTVVTASNGFAAMVKLGMVRPDLLVVDLHMPEMDGFRMLEALREMPELQGMTTIVVTGLSAQQIADRGVVPEGIPVLPKPIEFARLRDIATVIADRKQRSAS